MNIDQMRELVKECGLDWHRGFMPLFDGDETNRYAVLIEEAIESSGLQAEVERLTAENAELRKGMEQQKDTWLSWEGKRRDPEKDAERWRFSMWYQQEHLKNPSLRCEPIDELYRSRKELSAENYESAIDAAIIDKAMKETP